MDIRAVKFRVGHGWRVGGLLRPDFPGLTPAVLMLHGFPGVQRNEDLAAELCRRGVTVLMPNMRGCWGSEGEFSLNGMMEDARADLRLLSRYHHVDRTRIGLLGYSLGGWVALRLAAECRVAAVAALAPAVPRETREGDAAYLRKSGRVVNISDVQDVWEEYRDIARDEPPERYVLRISPTPLLIAQGLKDRLVPPSSALQLWALAGQPKELLELPEEGHEFQTNRGAFVASICDWMETRLGARAGSGVRR